MMYGCPETGSVVNCLASKTLGTANMTWAEEVTQSSLRHGRRGYRIALLGSLPPINM